MGKTHLVIGISRAAIQAVYKVLFKSALTLVEKLEMAEMTGELKKRLTQLSKYDVLIIDELDYLLMLRQSRYNVFQLINNLYEYRSIIVTANKDFASWGEFYTMTTLRQPLSTERTITHTYLCLEVKAIN